MAESGSSLRRGRLLSLNKQHSWSPDVLRDEAWKNRRTLSLNKQHSWSPDVLRDEAWKNRRKNNLRRRRGCVTDDDLDELRGCLDLGFSFDSPDIDPKLSSTFPALEFYNAIKRNYENCLGRSSSASFSDCDTSSLSCGSPRSIVDPGDDPVTVKMKLRQWAQMVACSIRQSLPRT